MTKTQKEAWLRDLVKSVKLKEKMKTDLGVSDSDCDKYIDAVAVEGCKATTETQSS